jgi:hypothetical protein
VAFGPKPRTSASHPEHRISGDCIHVTAVLAWLPLEAE